MLGATTKLISTTTSDLDRRTGAFNKHEFLLIFAQQPTSLVDTAPVLQGIPPKRGIESDNSKFIKHRDWLKHTLRTIHSANAKGDATLDGLRKGLIGRLQTEILALEEMVDLQWYMLKLRAGIAAEPNIQRKEPLIVESGKYPLTLA